MALALFFAAYLTARTSRAAMNWLCGAVIFPVMRRISRLCDFFDGSVGEVLLLTGIWAAVIWLACTVRRLATGPRRGAVLADFMLTAGCIALTVYAGFCLLWGTAYNTDGFQEKSGITAQPVSAEALERVTLYFAEELSAAAGEVPRTRTASAPQTGRPFWPPPGTPTTAYMRNFPSSGWRRGA